ncbi:hypothetical protein D3C80_2077520 [compost metagenome]
MALAAGRACACAESSVRVMRGQRLVDGSTGSDRLVKGKSLASQRATAARRSASCVMRACASRRCLADKVPSTYSPARSSISS